MDDDTRAGLRALFASVRDGVVISETIEEHFGVVVSLMNRIGSERHGSSSFTDAQGRACIVDNYELPNGVRFRAGYPRALWSPTE